MSSKTSYINIQAPPVQYGTTSSPFEELFGNQGAQPLNPHPCPVQQIENLVNQGKHVVVSKKLSEWEIKVVERQESGCLSDILSGIGKLVSGVVRCATFNCLCMCCGSLETTKTYTEVPKQ